MGAWGHAPFDNDDAADWAYEAGPDDWLAAVASLVPRLGSAAGGPAER